jgi:16S rRNA (uracil1498-N3)-methyltransferase
MKQSRRSILPEISEPVGIFDCLDTFTDEESAKFILFADSPNSLTELLSDYRNTAQIFLLVGPEGDFTLKEIEAAAKNGFRTASLGSRRLRSETAGIMSISIVLAHN